MNAEIDAEPDKQHCKRDRDEIEMTDRQGGETGSPDKPRHERRENREHEPQGTDSPGEQYRDQDEADHPGIRRPAGNAFKFFGRNDHPAGQPHRDAVVGGQTGLGRHFPDARHGFRRRGERSEIDAGFRHDDPPVGTVAGLPADQPPPRQHAGFAVRDGGGDRRQTVEDRGDPGHLSGLVGPVDGIAEHRVQAAQGRIGGKLHQKGLGFGNIVGKPDKLFAVQIEQPVADEKRVGLGREHQREIFAVRPQPAGQNFRRLVGAVGQVCIYDDCDIVRQSRKRMAERLEMLPERQIVRDHPGGIGIDLEIARDVYPGHRRQQQRPGQHHPRRGLGVSHHGPHQAGERIGAFAAAAARTGHQGLRRRYPAASQITMTR